MGYSAPEHAANAETIALEQRHCDKGRHGEEGDRAANVDEAETDADTASNGNSILGDAALFVDLRDPIGEGKSLVSSEGPNIPCDCSKVRHVGADKEKDYKCQHDCEPCVGHRLSKDVDDGVEGRVCESVIDNGDMVSDRDESREDQKEVDDVDAEHRLGYSFRSVLDLFRHVCRLHEG